jgi:hypothetical protein
MGSKRSLEKAFDVYAVNLTLCAPEALGVFVCPFCKRIFHKDAVTCKPPRVIFAHCAPKALDGRLTALACAECDNTAGHEVDVHLINRLETTSFFRGESPDSRRVWLKTVGQRVRADYRVVKGADGRLEQHLIIDGEHSPPGQCDELKRAMESGEALPHTLKLTQRGQMSFNMDLSRIAMLRAAFLFMFRSFGYAYVLHPNLTRLREQFQKPCEAIIPCRPVVGIAPSSLPDNSVCLITAPEQFRAFLVVLPFRTEGGTPFTQGIIMPGLGPEGDSVYERIRDHQAENESLSFGYVLIEEELGRLADPKYTWLANELWHQLTEPSGDAPQ